MKKLLVCLLTLVMVTLTTSAQSVKAIRKYVAVIESNPGSGKIQVHKNDSISETRYNKDTLTGYYNNAIITKMVSKKLGPTNMETFEYYFKDGKLIYIRENSLFESDLAFMGEYFFHNNKMIDMNTTGHNRFENDEIDPEKTLLKETNDNTEKLNKAKTSMNKMNTKP